MTSNVLDVRHVRGRPLQIVTTTRIHCHGSLRLLDVPEECHSVTGHGVGVSLGPDSDHGWSTKSALSPNMETLSQELNQILIRSGPASTSLTLTSPRFPPFFRLHVRSHKLSVNRSRQVGHLLLSVVTSLFPAQRRSIKDRESTRDLVSTAARIRLYVETGNATLRVNSDPAPSSELEGGFQSYTLYLNLIPRGISYDTLERISASNLISALGQFATILITPHPTCNLFHGKRSLRPPISWQERAFPLVNLIYSNGKTDGGGQLIP